MTLKASSTLRNPTAQSSTVPGAAPDSEKLLRYVVTGAVGLRTRGLQGIPGRQTRSKDPPSIP